MPTRSNLASLLTDVEVSFEGDADTVVTGIAYDSRQVNPGDVFVAVPGFVHDGVRFIPDAIEAGATAIVAEVGLNEANVPTAPALWAKVADSRAVLAPLAAAFYGHPSHELAVVGITGTNGKTTVTALLEAILAVRGPVGRWSTTTVSVAGAPYPAHRTTPEGPELQAVLRRMVDADCWAAAIEVSSHALNLRRVDGTRFAAAVFTNLSNDHLDFHADMGAYLDAKALLFERLGSDAVAVFNVDDPATASLVQRTAARVVGYGWKNRPVSSAKVRELLELDQDGRPPQNVDMSSVEATEIEPVIDVPTYRIVEWGYHGDGNRMCLETPDGDVELQTPLFGPANAENLAAAFALARELGLTVDEIATVVATFHGARGRFQRIMCGQPFAVLVDFAHTPAALQAALAASRTLAGAHRVIVVFGCGGDRDKSKRPLMGAIAANGADEVMITSDNPRGEDPGAILDDIEGGVPEGTRAQVTRQSDRLLAIELALARARPGDCVLIAGKGHETEQIFADLTVAFDDAQVATAWLEDHFTPTTSTAAGNP